ncbi:MAG: amine dehydrogenase large subunit, partial [Pseudomonadota bacterium]
ETLEPIAPETIPTILTLPKDYPATWFFAHDLNFNNMLDGRLVILDAAAETRNYKGALPSGMAGGFAHSAARGELYISETIHEMRVRGPRKDYLIVYDAETLEPKADIEIPPKRWQGLPADGNLALTNDDQFALVYNFTPASSVTVVDLESREVVSEVPIPGCSMIYPIGERGFSTICGDGGLITVKLDEAGAVASETPTPSFIDIDDDAMMIMGAESGGVLYFPTFQGHLQPVDLSGDTPAVSEKFSIVPEAEKEKNWRPGGWQLVASDADGLVYVLMHEGGKEGTHKDPGAHVWAISPETKARERVLELATPAISIAITPSEPQLLLATNINFAIDVYDLASGELQRTLGGAAAAPFALYTASQ